MRVRIVTIGLDDFARDRPRQWKGKDVGEIEIRLLQPDPKRMPVKNLESGYRSVVIEPA